MLSEKKFEPWMKLVITHWNKLPFCGFSQADQKMDDWKKYALAILSNLQTGNVGLIADTGTGKTIMALLVFEALKIKTLFLAPTVILVNQHADLYKKISGQKANVITGEKKKRDWQANSLTIATPHVFLVEKQKALVDSTDFDLIIIDELHKASGDYPYVELINNFNADHKKIIALSASPGANADKIDYFENLYQIKNWVTAEIEMPIKNQRLIRCPITENLKAIDALLRGLAFENLVCLNKLFDLLPQEQIVSFTEDVPFLTQKENDELEKAVKKLPSPQIYQGYSLFAKHYKISHLFKLIMTESYFSFHDYVCNSLAKDKTKATKNLFSEEKWQKLYRLATVNSEPHPKEIALLSLVREMLWRSKRMLIFINHKKTAIYLAEKLNKAGYLSATLFGGRQKSIKKQAEVIDDFLNRKIQIIIATSVVEEGLSLPEVDVVIHYSQPMTEISRLQRDGRTGRFYEGLVCFLITDIPYENNLYFATLARLKKMRSLFYETYRQAEDEKKQAKNFAKKRAADQKSNQLSLDFPDDLPF